MNKAKRVLITGTGAVAGAIARALVPAGYEVETIGKAKNGITVFLDLELPLGRNSDAVYQLLMQPSKQVDPYTTLPTVQVPHKECNLRIHPAHLEKHFQGFDTVILTAANPDARQYASSANLNHLIDRHSIDTAIATGAKTIIYTSSVWRTAGYLNNVTKKESIQPEASASTVNAYGEAKAKSVDYLQEVAKKHQNILFATIDLGWYPRETIGQPIANVDERYIQWWIAESELQQHYLLLCNIRNNKKFKNRIEEGENMFSFNGFSVNTLPKGRNHPLFPYTTTTSRELGVKQQHNVYDVLKKRTTTWRKIPVPAT